MLVVVAGLVHKANAAVAARLGMSSLQVDEDTRMTQRTTTLVQSARHRCRGE